MSNDTMEEIQPEVNSSHAEDHVSEIGVSQKDPDASHSFETVLEIEVSENAESHLNDSVSEIEVTTMQGVLPQKIPMKRCHPDTVHQPSLNTWFLNFKYQDFIQLALRV
ncbi:hypothetical protein O181_033092 [Austropuccinia psidii MF-1]|uniref:Uncharacterized protein n=1 Tax=Austropuccinia psidii MF-1 TaxID=1389203 RepID=A0A9Q3H6U8_9BASI|nr:hypothetical protein [Austropuccinia psidii MF-1]